MHTTLTQQIQSLLVFGALSAIALFVGFRRGFFSVVYAKKIPQIRLSTAFISFVFFFLVTSLLFPLIFNTVVDVAGRFVHVKHLPLEVFQSMAYTFAVVLTVFLILTLLSTRSKMALNTMLKDFKFEGASTIGWDILIGVFGWLIALPVVSCVATFTDMIVDLIFNTVVFEQDAISYLKKTKEYPFALIFSVFTIVLLAPFLEELLFRGIIQNYFSNLLGDLWGLIVASAIFAGVHFSFSHGLGNISLIVSLFALSLLIGHTYNRQRSLFAPFAFHAIFNGFTVIRLLIGGDM